VISSMVQSDEPAVVLSSLARLGNPPFSDACAIELSERTGTPFRIRFPCPARVNSWPDQGPSTPRPAHRVVFKTVTTRFHAEPSHGYPSFAGTIVHSWATREPTENDAIVARLLVNHALAIMHKARLAQAVARADSRRELSEIAAGVTHARDLDLERAKATEILALPLAAEPARRPVSYRQMPLRSGLAGGIIHCSQMAAWQGQVTM